MKLKKWIKYSLLTLAVLMAAGFYAMNRDGQRIYGALTERVDHTQFVPEGGPFAIANVNLLSEDGERMIPNQTILIKDGLIAAIDSSLNIPAGTRVIDGTGKYLIPGLIDSHVHLFQSPNDLLLYLANGVTQIRELIGEEDHLEWKREIDEGRIGPKMFVASPRLGTFGAMEGAFMTWSQGYMNVPAEEAAEIVQDLHDSGYDGLKIYSQLTKESYLAIANKANELNMPIFGHIPWSLELDDIWDNGQSSVAHFEELMNALQRDFDPEAEGNFGSFYGREDEFLQFVAERSSYLAENLIKSNISVSTTLWLTESFVKQKFELDQVLREVELEYQNPGISEWVSYIPGGLGWLPAVNRYKLNDGLSEERKATHTTYWTTYGKACSVLATELSKRGVKLMTGTDANLPPTVPGFSLHDEFGSLSRAGLSNAEVLRAATVNPSEWLKSNTGVISAGYEANLVLLDKSPLENISNTRAINTVISRGQIFDRSLLDNILAAVRQANDNSRKVSIDEYLD